MRKLTRRQTFNSLVFPMMTTVWALFKYTIKVIFYGFAIEPTDFVFFAAIGIGGVLCAVLTVTIGIETGQYFLPRLLILISTIFVIAVAEEFLEFDYRINLFLVLISLVFGALYFKKNTKFSEWIIVFLSNPVLYYFVIMIFTINEYQEAIQNVGMF
ncbi:MAG: hypothetical protein ACI4JY_05540 [Oscillospiraceae bacterium]